MDVVRLIQNDVDVVRTTAPRKFEVEVARLIIPKLIPPYRKDAQVYVDCFPKLYLALAKAGTEKSNRFMYASYLTKALHDDHTISFNLLIALELAGFMKKDKVRHETNKKWSQTLYTPTPKLLSVFTSGSLPESLKFPIIDGQPIPVPIVRRGIAQKGHREVIESISETRFIINSYIATVISEEMDITTEVMAHRAVRTAEYIGTNKYRFPYFLDKRGRIYCDVTTGVNPQGADFEKAMVLPAFREVLTPEGYQALLAHADTQSEDKTLTTLAPHLKGHAYAAVAAAVGFDDSWKKWDKPYYGLSIAQTIREHLCYPDQPINAFVERDGKCSGLQHWSALLRTNAITNRLGMEIEPAEDGLDIYEYVASEFAKTEEEPFLSLINRKTAKKTVMTFAYSATRSTSMDDLFGLYPHLGGDARRMGSRLFDVSNKILEPMVHGVNWFKACVKIITEKHNTHEIQWYTPDGFLAYQSYAKSEYSKVRISVKRRFYEVQCKDNVVDENGRLVPKLSKAQSAIGPNIIHSLDATHLRMVAKRLGEMGIDSIWIHDSFAVHANYIPILDRVIREEFVALYSRDIMSEIKDYWEEHYDVVLPPCPKLGEWKVETVMSCPKFFS